MQVSEFHPEAKKFFDSIDPLSDAYDRITFGYVAIKVDGAFKLRGAKLTFGIGEAPVPYDHFRSENVRAGQYRLSELASNPREMLGKLLSDSLVTPHGELQFPRDDSGEFRYSYTPFNKPALDLQHRVNVLTIIGGFTPDLGNQPHLDWELKAAEKPYDSVQELMLAFQCFDSVLLHSAYVVVEAHHVAAVDFNVAIQGTHVRPRIVLARSLPTEMAQLGYCVYSGGKAMTRARVSGAEMEWFPAGDSIQHGEFALDVPSGSVMHCFASYNGIAQQHGWIVDPKIAQNPRRAIYSAFDHELSVLRELLAGRGKHQGPDFETGVRWLFWMLGFSVADVGGHAKTRKAPDLIAMTPQGHVAVIECTTEGINHDNKLSKLQARAIEIRRRLQDSGNTYPRVLPVITTCFARDSIGSDLAEAEQRQICVLTNENLDSLLQRTHPLTNADVFFEEGEQLATSGQLHQR